MTVHTRLDPPLVELLRKALTRNALPGETAGLKKDKERDAAEFLTAVAMKRQMGDLALRIESSGGEAEFCLVVTRRTADGRHEPVALVSDEALLDRAIRKAA